MDALEKANNNSNGSSERETKRTPSSTRKWIIDEVAALGLALGDDVSPQRLVVYADDLCDIPREQLANAFRRARREYEYPKLPPVAFIRRMAGANTLLGGRPEPEEAWARMPKGRRIEEDSIVWCEEERVAYGVCRGLLLDGDRIGARMAFKERYEKELAEAISQRKPARWSISAGYDIEHRLLTLATAVQEKRICVEAALNFIPDDRRTEFAKMLPPAERTVLLTGEVQLTPEIPGLAGVLAKMRMEDTLPEDLKSNPRPLRRSPSDRSPEEARNLRENINAQRDFLKRSRNGTGSDEA